MKKASNTGIIIAIILVLSSYFVFSLGLEIPFIKLGTLYALTGHLSWIIISVVFLIESKNSIVKFLSLYTAIFFSLVLILFVYVGIIEDQSYFKYKLCIYLSIPITIVYEAVSIIRKHKANN